MTSGRAVRLIAAVAAAAVALVGCSDLKPGPAGRVIVKDTDTQVIVHPAIGKTPGWTQLITSYYLTTKDPADGSTTRFKVEPGVYDHCYRGSSYPRCSQRKG